MSIVDKILQVAENEVGYLEKRSNSQLYDKIANAGSGNYTKYWADTVPSYQGQPWCADYVTWCVEQVVGKENAAKLFGHYPYVYCPTGMAMAKAQGRWSNIPSKGAVIIFCNSSGTASHTGIVYAYDDNYVYTNEGNTSAGSTVIANGGAVCKKSYSRGYSRILGYWALDYESIESEDELMSKEYDELNQLIESKDAIINKMGEEIAAGKAENAELRARIEKLENPMVYDYIDENMPGWSHEDVKWCVDNQIVLGTGDGLGLDDKDLRICAMIRRAVNLICKLINVKL